MIVQISRSPLWVGIVVAALVSAQAAWAQSGKSSGQSAYEKLISGAKTTRGLFTVHQKGSRVYLELTRNDLNKDFIVLISIARGIGEGPVLGGMTWGFGDDWLWQFRKVDNKIQVVRRNVRFTAKKGSPEHRAVQLAYTDSILYSLSIKATSPSGGMVIDLNEVFMTDLPQIGRVLGGFSFSASRSSWAKVKNFRDNLELEVAATYISSGMRRLETVPDSRAVTVNVHYSISRLPNTGYKPRLADDRVGYFLTVIKDFSKEGDQDRFIRYINRWDLQKVDPSLEKSPPKKPIIFWLEKTVPYKYRKAIRDGILEWNKAFERIGFVNAIEVRQQPDSADWDPEDINYNTFRWITASAGFAMGPSRVNPTTGQILDADIIFDADFVQYWREEYEVFTPASVAAMTGGPLDLESYRQHGAVLGHRLGAEFTLHQGMARQLALGALCIKITARAVPKAQEEEMIMQGLKEVVMHEVGHTLGLRHNFKASTHLKLSQLHDKAHTAQHGLSASVMDYLPANIALPGKPQGYYFSPTLGAYDYWAIEYGYKPLPGGTWGEVPHLQKIASRCGEPGLDYATDEDTRGVDPDPLSNRFDLGSDPVEYAQHQAQLVRHLLPQVVDRLVDKGEGYQKARRGFGILLGTYGRAMFLASRYIGGMYVHRDHKGDKGARPPFVIVPAEKQRQALKLLEEGVFSDKPFQVPPQLYNFLAPTRWNHWGMRVRDRVDYPVHQVILMWQTRILDRLLSPLTLERLCDAELKLPADQDAFTVAELLERLTKAIFAELESIQPGQNYTLRKPAISSVRRNLQRAYLDRLARLSLGQSSAPEDCQSLATLELRHLKDRIEKVLSNSKIKLDRYTLAHLQDTLARVEKVLRAQVTLDRP